ncbi:MAG: hypothetical protein M3R24_40225 [Chloroflexota bacterium]|nr:hypothetical protein [Chloroflexota bacterium]
MFTEPPPAPLPSPLAYPNAVSRPKMATKVGRAKAEYMILAGLMALTGCSRADARRALGELLSQIEAGRGA